MDKHQKLYDQILDYAKKTDQIRVVEMNGSRVNQLIEPDDYQDFDIVFYVKDFNSFIQLEPCVNQFGEILVMQTKDDQIIDQCEQDAPWYVYLVQYKDGTRLDLTIKEVTSLESSMTEDSLSKIILDKDNRGIEQTANESSYYVKEPAKKNFKRVVNEFYWVSPYVSKGIARNHLVYAYKHLNIVRNQLEKVLDWWIGMTHDYKVSVGKGKHRYQQFLSKTWYTMYQKTFSDLTAINISHALEVAIELFDDVCKKIIERYDFPYDCSLKNRMIIFIKKQHIIKES